ncbi:MAG: Gfo/Idh/MocA family oxidoreductase, partial [Polyangiaceae bacterium]
REARALVAEGALGDIRLVQAEYLQGWLSDETHSKQAQWRTDPARAGAGALGDIGTHAWQLAAFVTGQVPSHVSADLSSMVPGRAVDDDSAGGAALSPRGAKGDSASQVAVGQGNGLSLRVFGARAALEWQLQDSERLILSPKDGPRRS